MMGAGVLGYAIYKTSQGAEKVVDVISETGNAVNPVNENNIFNSGITTLVEDATDGRHSGGGALGSWIFCKLNPDAIACKPYVMPTQNTLKSTIGSGQ